MNWQASESFTEAHLAQFISQATHKPVDYQNLSAMTCVKA